MKIGSTYIIKASLDVDMNYVESIIFTLSNQHKITKNYPEEVSVDADGKFNLGLSQHDTLLLGVGTVDIEAQINFRSKSVVKTTISSIKLDETLGTKIINGNKPDGVENDHIELLIDDVIVYASIGGGSTSWGEIGGIITNQKDLIAVLNNKATKADVETMTANYVETHKAELKGDKGDTGDAGSNYVITSSDYNAIADVVIGKLPMVESEAF